MFITELLIKLASYFVGILLACFIGLLIKTVIEEVIKDINEYEHRKLP